MPVVCVAGCRVEVGVLGLGQVDQGMTCQLVRRREDPTAVWHIKILLKLSVIVRAYFTL
jgi:hypothetical protein